MDGESEEAAQVIRRRSPPGGALHPFRTQGAGRAQRAAIPGVFRVSPEPCRYHAEAEVHAALTADPAGYLEFVHSGLAAIAAGEARLTLPPKQVFEDPATGGDFRVMPCELSHAGRLTKTVKLVGTNTVQATVPDQITVGRLLVLDPRENFVSDIFEACLLSSARTGACAALAMSLLCRRRREVVIIGAGRVGLYAALYCAAAGGVSRVRFCDRAPGRGRTAARWLGRAAPGVRAEACATSEIAAADVVVLATTSRDPVVSPPAWGARLVVSLGADADTQSELDARWSRRAELYCDTADSLRFGDLKAWLAAGLTRPGRISDLLAVLRDPPAATPGPRVFVSTGSALFDNLTARYLLEGRPRNARSRR
jgi:ornithine cyclodeaminase